MKTVLLYSGGMDSWVIRQLEKPDVALYIDTGTSYAAAEQAMLPKDVKVVPLPLRFLEREDKIVPMRNLMFVALASVYGDRVILGATAGDRVLDKSKKFATMSSALLSFLWQPQHWTEGKQVKVVVPYKDSTKVDLLLLYVASGGTLQRAWDESFSCYAPSRVPRDMNARRIPCWSCKPCVRKWAAFSAVGFHPPIEATVSVLHNYRQFVEGRGEEGEQIMQEVDKWKRNL